MKSIKAAEGQTIYDIAIKEYGCFEGVFLVCEDNGFTLTTELVPMQDILIREEVPEYTDSNTQIVDYFKANGLKPNSNYPLQLEGDFENIDFNNIDFYA